MKKLKTKNNELKSESLKQSFKREIQLEWGHYMERNKKNYGTAAAITITRKHE